MRRSVAWEEGLAEDFKDPEFITGFLIAAVEDGISLQFALGKVIRCLGVNEFSKKVKIPSSNILRAIDPKHNPTQETLNRLLKPFGLMLTVAPIVKKKAA
jgi:DNA-binding phage protein